MADNLHIIYQFTLHRYNPDGTTDENDDVKVSLWNNHHISMITCDQNADMEKLAYAAMSAIRRYIKSDRRRTTEIRAAHI